MFFSLLLFSCLFLSNCKKDEEKNIPSILLRTGDDFVANGSLIKPGEKLKFGIVATGRGANITYLRIQRNADNKLITEIDKGTFYQSQGIDTVFTFMKSNANVEIWTFFIMNSNRDTASVSIKILKAEGTAYGEINFFTSVILSYQNNHSYPHFLNFSTGKTYDENTVIGHESEIDLLYFFYITSGKSSPTISCPGYPTIGGYYQIVNNWIVKNNTAYDYYSSDYDLVSLGDFQAAQDDYLLVSSFKPDKTSGLSKFSYTGKIIPFRTQQGKYGLIHVIRADETENGTIEIEYKIQK